MALNRESQIRDSCGYDFASGVHKYLYAEDDPVDLMDPSGKDAFDIGFDIGFDFSLFSVRNLLVSTGTLTDRQIANIIFNETRSLSGSTLDQARQNVAHAIINGDQLQASGKGRRPRSASTRATVLAGEAGAYQDCFSAVIAAKLDWVDPTSGGIHFNLRKNNWRGPFQGHPIRTQSGPFLNSYPTSELPAKGIYVNTYE